MPVAIVATDPILDLIEQLAERRKELEGAIDGYAKRVVAGVKLLDKLLLPNWDRKIKLSDLELENTQRCVLGQLAAKSALRSAGYSLGREDADYNDAITALDIEPADYGFNTNMEIEESVEELHDNISFSILNHLWSEAIRLRRKGLSVNATALKKAVQVL